MELKVLASSSSGNGYLLETRTEALLLEAGAKPGEVKKAVDYNVGKIAGCLITHEHKDHARYVSELLSSGIDCYASRGTIDGMKTKKHHRMHVVEHNKPFMVGSFRVLPFNVKHDTAEPLGYLINQPQCGPTLFLTDSYYVEYTFPGLVNVLVECNYDEETLKENVKSGRVNEMVEKRVMRSHMEFSTAKEMLRVNNPSNKVILMHLSSSNADAERYRKEISDLLPGRQVYVADKGLTINIDQHPF